MSRHLSLLLLVITVSLCDAQDVPFVEFNPYSSFASSSSDNGTVLIQPQEGGFVGSSASNPPPTMSIHFDFDDEPGDRVIDLSNLSLLNSSSSTGFAYGVHDPVSSQWMVDKTTGSNTIPTSIVVPDGADTFNLWFYMYQPPAGNFTLNAVDELSIDGVDGFTHSFPMAPDNGGGVALQGPLTVFTYETPIESSGPPVLPFAMSPATVLEGYESAVGGWIPAALIAGCAFMVIKRAWPIWKQLMSPSIPYAERSNAKTNSVGVSISDEEVPY